MRKGFTVLELLVASLLLAMLVTMLSMMFNQSSIAWRTGVAGVAELNTVRAKLGAFHDIEDDVLPGVGQIEAKTGNADNRQIRYRTVSLWQKNQENKLRLGMRAFEDIQWSDASSLSLNSINSTILQGSMQSVGSAGSGVSMSAFAVGVQSAGPNRRWGDEDDITNWPEDVD